jgi:hypothetical protein
MPFLKPEIGKAEPVEEFLPDLGFRLRLVPGIKVVEYVYEWPLPEGGSVLIINDAFGSNDSFDRSVLMGRLLYRGLSPPGDRFGERPPLSGPV